MQQISTHLQKIFPNTLKAEFGWWIEILTVNPVCIYYFGDFDSHSEAQMHKDGYLEDLKQEGACIVSSQIKRCKPSQLTIAANEFKVTDFQLFPSLGEPA